MNEKDEKFFIVFSIIIALIILIFDFYTKYLILSNKELLYTPIRFIPKFFNLVFVKNSGIAWGLFQNRNEIFIFVGTTILCTIILCFKHITEGYKERYIALGFLIGGIAGNLLDRCLRGYVVDFLDFHIGRWHWPAFNIADSAISLAVAILIISFIVRDGKRKDNR